MELMNEQAQRVAKRFAASFSEEELAVLSTFDMHKPSHRKKVFEDAKLGEFSPDNPTIKKLIGKGLIKVTGKSMRLNKSKAREVMKQHPAPKKYVYYLDNVHMQFKGKEASNRWLSREEVAEVCPSCADKMASLGIRKIKASVFFEALIDESREVTAAEGDKWLKMPPGWTEESRKKMWASLVGDVKHKVTKCIKKMGGKVDDPGAFCAALADRVEGKEWRERDAAAERVAARFKGEAR